MRILSFILPILWCFAVNPLPSEFHEPLQPVVQKRNTDTLNWHKPRFEERKEEREYMVHTYIQNSVYNPVTDSRILDAMEAVPRHKFVPKQFQRNAYANTPLLIGYDQTISQPIIVAHMTELLRVKTGAKILEIGTGSGYQAAVLSELTPFVYSVEIIEKLGLNAVKLFDELGYNTIKVKIGDGYEGWSEHAPYDGIIVTCAPENIPEPLIKQLKPGGRIVIPLGRKNQVQNLVVIEKDKKGNLKQKVQYPVRFVPMTGKAEEKK